MGIRGTRHISFSETFACILSCAINRRLDGKHVVFGKIIQGMEIVRKMEVKELMAFFFVNFMKFFFFLYFKSLELSLTTTLFAKD